MLPYLTPERYRSMGMGTEDVDDSELRSHIQRASAAVDRYLGAPLIPDRYSFRGGTVTDEEHDFRLGNGVNQPPTNRFWPRSTPLVSVTSLRAYMTNTQYVEFSAGELFLTRDTINVTSLTVTSIGLFGNFAIPVVGLANPIARISYTYGYSFTSTGEYLEVTDGLTYRAQNQFWDDSDVTVTKDGSTITTGFTLDKEEGAVVMDEQQPAGTVIEATYGYPLIPEIAQATGLTVAKFLGDKALVEKGMQGVQSLRVGEIEIDRPRPRAATTNESPDLPNDAKQLLDGLHFITIR